MIETHVAIQGVCAWPNLTKLPDGTIVAAIFNQPCHGRWEGDLECWASTDGGHIWYYRGTAAKHDEGKNRMNHAAGLAHNGDMVVLCSGWDNRVKPYEKPVPFDQSNVLRAVVSRSSDQARTWQYTGELPESPGIREFVPFGDICQADDGTLRACANAIMPKENDEPASSVFMMIGDDDGRSWRIGSRITAFGNECALHHLGEGRWLAAARGLGSTNDRTDIPIARDAPETAFVRTLNLHGSDDDGQTWRWLGPVSMTGQIPGHILRLADGRLIVSYGNRCPNNLGVDARISHDNGASWGRPIRIADMLPGDGGYPSSVETEPGQIVTAFYNKLTGAYHFEMSVAHWRADDYDKAGPALGHAW